MELHFNSPRLVYPFEIKHVKSRERNQIPIGDENIDQKKERRKNQTKMMENFELCGVQNRIEPYHDKYYTI